jgi:hypothetical protein
MAMNRPRKTSFIVVLFAAASLLSQPGWAVIAPAAASPFGYDAKTSLSRFQTPEDVIGSWPVISSIPRTFLFSGGYKVKLSITEMRIDHMATHTRCPMTHRGCTLALSYGQPVGNDAFSSRVDFPLFSAEKVTTHWAPASFGDYVVHLSNTPMSSSSIRLLASAKF